MGVTRGIVLPTVRLTLMAAIAVALLKLAFGDDMEEPVSRSPVS